MRFLARTQVTLIIKVCKKRGSNVRGTRAMPWPSSSSHSQSADSNLRGHCLRRVEWGERCLPSYPPPHPSRKLFSFFCPSNSRLPLSLNVRLTTPLFLQFCNNLCDRSPSRPPTSHSPFSLVNSVFSHAHLPQIAALSH